jgi:hypothetical protein
MVPIDNRPKRSTARGWIVVIAVIVALIVLIVGIYVWYNEYILKQSGFRPLAPNVCPPDDAASVEAALKITLPPSTLNLDSYCGEDEDGGSAIFEIVPGELDALLKSTKIDMPLSSTRRVAYLTFTREQLDEIDSYLSGYYRDDFLIQEILINTSDPQNYIVYFTAIKRMPTPKPLN